MAAGIFSRPIFLAIAVAFHLTYIYSIVDIYFVSPVVSGMQLIPVDRLPGARAPADRIVLFVGAPSYNRHSYVLRTVLQRRKLIVPSCRSSR